MFVVIASDSPGVSTKVRRALAQNGHECPITNVVGLQQCETLLQSRTHQIDILVVVNPTDEVRGLALIRRLRKLTSAQLIAVGSSRNSKHILETLHAGADDYVDEDSELDEQFHASFERIELRSDSSSTGHLIAVTSASGGSGSSTIAANLAIKLSQRSESCALVELDAGFGDLAALLNLSPRYTIGDLLRHQEPIDRGMLEQSLVVHSSGVKLLAAAGPFDDVELTDAHAVSRIVALCRNLFSWSIMDVECRHSTNTELLKAAQTILLVLRMDFTSLCNTRRLLDAWKELQIDLDRVQLVANRVGQCGEVPMPQARQLLGSQFTACVPDDVLHANLSANCGNPVVIESPKSPLSRAIADIIDQIPGAAAVETTGSRESEHGTGLRSDTIVKKVASIFF